MRYLMLFLCWFSWTVRKLIALRLVCLGSLAVFVAFPDFVLPVKCCFLLLFVGAGYPLLFSYRTLVLTLCGLLVAGHLQSNNQGVGRNHKELSECRKADCPASGVPGEFGCLRGLPPPTLSFQSGAASFCCLLELGIPSSFPIGL